MLSPMAKATLIVFHHQALELLLKCWFFFQAGDPRVIIGSCDSDCWKQRYNITTGVHYQYRPSEAFNTCRQTMLIESNRFRTFSSFVGDSWFDLIFLIFLLHREEYQPEEIEGGIKRKISSEKTISRTNISFRNNCDHLLSTCLFLNFIFTALSKVRKFLTSDLKLQ